MVLCSVAASFIRPYKSACGPSEGTCPRLLECRSAGDDAQYGVDYDSELQWCKTYKSSRELSCQKY